jgi:hypothetical protein
MAKTQEVDETGISGDLASPTVHDKFADYMKNRATLDESIDPNTAMDAISANVLTAESEEELWDADEGSLPGGDDVVGIEQRIFGFDVRASKDETKKNIRTGNAYLVIHAARLDNGHEFDWNTSSTLIVQKLIALERLGAFSDGNYRDCVVKATTTGSGFEVLKLARIQPRAI